MEDDRAMLGTLTEALADEGYRVIPVPDWRDAHPTIQREHPAAVLLDLCADGQETGWKVLNYLTLDPSTRDVPVILTTGAVASVEARRPALLPEYGVSVLLKPFDLEALWTMLDRVVERSSVAR